MTTIVNTLVNTIATTVVASAPGKAVLCGEYAVLDGAPAVCMALDRRARVTVTPFEGDWNRVSAPGYSAVEGLIPCSWRERRMAAGRG